MHKVVLPDHVPSDLHDLRRDPVIRYPLLQVKEAWEPKDDPHEKAVMAPFVGGWRTGQDFPVKLKMFSFLIRKKKNSFVSLTDVSTIL